MSEAKDTKVLIRVIANDGKFLGDDIGGAAITVRDADTKEILAQGKVRGDSGPNYTAPTSDQPGQCGVMCAKLRRGEPIPTDAGTSKFEATLRLGDPRRIEVTAFGPLAARASANTVSITTWVYPGVDITEGNAILLEMQGLLCQVVGPPAHTVYHAAEVRVVANVAMMCGCPISHKKKGALCPDEPQPWQDTDFEVFAVCPPLKQVRMPWVAKHGIPGQFACHLTVPKDGIYQLTVYAHQKSTGNTGVDFSSFSVST